MTNSYKTNVVEMSVAAREYIVLEATAAQTIVKQVAYTHKDHNSTVLLKIQKAGSSTIEINEVSALAGKLTTLTTDVVALSVGDKLIVEADHISATDVAYAMAVYAESSTLPEYPSILGLADVNAATTDGYVLAWDDSTNSANWVAGGAGAVESVNGQTGVVVLDSDDIAEGTTNRYVTTADETKLGFISVTGAVNLDNMATTSYVDTEVGNEETARITADSGLQTQITTNAGNISTNAGDISSLQSDLSALSLVAVRSVNGEPADAGGDVSIDTSLIPEGSNLYYTDARVSANADVFANTAKLATIATGAEVNVNADWNASSGDAQILNKPTIPSEFADLAGNTDDVSEGQTNLYFTDARADARISAASILDLSDTPATYGTSGQVLTTDGTGSTTWETPSGGGALLCAHWSGRAQWSTTQTASNYGRILSGFYGVHYYLWANGSTFVWSATPTIEGSTTCVIPEYVFGGYAVRALYSGTVKFAYHLNFQTVTAGLQGETLEFSAYKVAASDLNGIYNGNRTLTAIAVWNVVVPTVNPNIAPIAGNHVGQSVQADDLILVLTRWVNSPTITTTQYIAMNLQLYI